MVIPPPLLRARPFVLFCGAVAALAGGGPSFASGRIALLFFLLSLLILPAPSEPSAGVPGRRSRAQVRRIIHIATAPTSLVPPRLFCLCLDKCEGGGCGGRAPLTASPSLAFPVLFGGPRGLVFDAGRPPPIPEGRLTVTGAG